MHGNSLEELFNKNDFDFINTLENNIDEIHHKISNQKKKRKQVIALLKLSNKQKDSNNNNSCLDDSNEIIKLINSNIASLYSIEVNLNNICQNFTGSYIPNFFKPENDAVFNSIKSNIATYSDELSSFNSTFEKNNSRIDNFFKKNEKQIKAAISYENSNKINLQSNRQLSNENVSLDNDIHEDNPYLVVSEKDKKVFLPYKVSEIHDYLEKYPNSYSSFEDVVEKEFILSLDYYTKRPVHTRFRETYSLIRDREGKSILEALKYSFDLMFRNDLNPTIIAACKTQNQLDDYLKCLEDNNLDNFNHFKIQFYVNPL